MFWTTVRILLVITECCQHIKSNTWCLLKFYTPKMLAYQEVAHDCNVTVIELVASQELELLEGLPKRFHLLSECLYLLGCVSTHLEPLDNIFVTSVTAISHDAAWCCKSQTCSYFQIQLPAQSGNSRGSLSIRITAGIDE